MSNNKKNNYFIYLDNNSTTEPYPKVVSTISLALEKYYANPFTQYKMGRNVSQQMEKCRTNIKKMLGIYKKEHLIFTASATESNNMLIRGRLDLFSSTSHLNKKKNALLPHIIISNIEHGSVYQTCLDLEKSGKCSLSIIPTDCQGNLYLDKLADEIKNHSHHLVLICLILANNEIGVIQNLEAIIPLCKHHFLHIDATQYIGKYPIQISSLCIQSMTFGSHKFHGPRMGALYLQDIYSIKNSCCTGGRSEYGLRSGTPNVSYILGMEKALSISLENMKKNQKHICSLRDYLENNLKKVKGVKINSDTTKRLYNTSSIVLPIQGNSKKLVEYLDRHNICVNVGSACNMNSKSRILENIGLTLTEQKSTIRVSFSSKNTRKECDIFLTTLQKFFLTMKNGSK